MKVLLLNGSPHKEGNTYIALNEVAKTLEENGVETEIIYLGTKPLQGCIACGRCKQLGQCVFNDEVNEVLDKMDEADGLVIGSPVYYAAPSGRFCSFLNRLFYAGGADFKGKVGAAVVACRRGGASAAFDQLNKYFTISQMPIVSSQYWNQIHGTVPGEALKDEEGLQTMRTLGRNMAWLLKSINAANEKGIEHPESETPIKTNFIR